MADCGQSTLRTDLVPQELLESPEKIRVIAGTAYYNIVQKVKDNKTRTPGPAKNIVEVMDLIKSAIEDYEVRLHTAEDAKINVTYEEPDKPIDLETLTIKLIKREPGMFSQGSPFENKTRQLKPILREEIDDPENPGYKRAVMGQYYDNLIRLTCWARTNKQANERALWVETVMEEYDWFFVYSGVNRMIYQGRGPEETIKVDESKLYGRCIEYFVRTEKLTTISEKELECVVVRQATVAPK